MNRHDYNLAWFILDLLVYSIILPSNWVVNICKKKKFYKFLSPTTFVGGSETPPGSMLRNTSYCSTSSTTQGTIHECSDKSYALWLMVFNLLHSLVWFVEKSIHDVFSVMFQLVKSRHHHKTKNEKWKSIDWVELLMMCIAWCFDFWFIILKVQSQQTIKINKRAEISNMYINSK